MVELARSALEGSVSGRPGRAPRQVSGFLSEKRGVFVTLNRAESGGERLRGCIGFPYPVKQLGEAVVEAAIAAGTEDPRFPPVEQAELGEIVVEVSVLTPPRPLETPTRIDAPKHVKIGRDGLIVSRSYASGLLLPQVATEFGLGPQDFLSETCLKAGLTPDAWLDESTSIQVFQAEIFAEARPRGDVKRMES